LDSVLGTSTTWGVAPGWDEAAPLALSESLSQARMDDIFFIMQAIKSRLLIYAYSASLATMALEPSSPRTRAVIFFRMRGINSSLGLISAYSVQSQSRATAFAWREGLEWRAKGPRHPSLGQRPRNGCQKKEQG
jgi:hypothetical protein